ncbi:MAG: hypothetical protein QXF15_03305 [Candidatus Aenigmatarchaeota archaeon]
MKLDKNDMKKFLVEYLKKNKDIGVRLSNVCNAYSKKLKVKYSKRTLVCYFFEVVKDLHRQNIIRKVYHGKNVYLFYVNNKNKVNYCLYCKKRIFTEGLKFCSLKCVNDYHDKLASDICAIYKLISSYEKPFKCPLKHMCERADKYFYNLCGEKDD